MTITEQQRKSQEVEIIADLRKMEEILPSLSDDQWRRLVPQMHSLKVNFIDDPFPPPQPQTPVCLFGDKCKYGEKKCRYLHTSAAKNKLESAQKVLEEYKKEAKLSVQPLVRKSKVDEKPLEVSPSSSKEIVKKNTVEIEVVKEPKVESVGSGTGGETKSVKPTSSNESSLSHGYGLNCQFGDKCMYSHDSPTSDGHIEETKDKAHVVSTNVVANRRGDDVDDEFTEDGILRKLRYAFNRVAWSNYDILLAEVASLIDTLSVLNLLNKNVSERILMMMVDYTIYEEAYGKMWVTLSEVYPCLHEGTKALMDNYMDYYSTFKKFYPTPAMKQQRKALTAFLTHLVQYSSGSLERDEVGKIMGLIVERLKDLRMEGHHKIPEFDALAGDLIVLMIKGGSHMYREDMWPSCVREIEEILEFHSESKCHGGKGINTKILFALEDLMADIYRNSRYHIR
jgi:hypothetical protein